jgi:rRNA-processing protein FCF1
MESPDDYISALLSRYKSKGILIDTNLLLVYFIAMYDSRRIESFKRVKSKAFSIKDLELLARIVGYFDKIVTTPNILTEVSNLSNELSEAERPVYYQVFASQVSFLNEEYVPSLRVCSLEHFNRFHLTDSGIIDLVKDKHLVLTDDFKLSGYLRSSGIDCINFDHLRVIA